MKQKLLAMLLTLCVLAGLLPAAAIRAEAADALPAELVLAPSEANGLPAASSGARTMISTFPATWTPQPASSPGRAG